MTNKASNGNGTPGSDANVNAETGVTAPDEAGALLQDGFNSLMSRIEMLRTQGNDQKMVNDLVAMLKRCHAAGIVPDDDFHHFKQQFGGDPCYGDRPGRSHEFSIDVQVGPTEEPTTITFDVKATNAVDAYVALSKRATYRALSDVLRVSVFQGLQNDRVSLRPLRVFQKDELIFV